MRTPFLTGRTAVAALLTCVALVRPTIAAPADGWLLLSNHNHSHDSNDYSHDPDHVSPAASFSSDGIAEIGRIARDHGIDAVVLSDHNTIRGCHDPKFGTGGVGWMCGEELTAGSAHATVLFPNVPDLRVDKGEPFHPYHMLREFCDAKGCRQHRSGARFNLPGEAMSTMLSGLQARGAFAIINHPDAGLPPLLMAGLFPSTPQARTVGSWSWPYRSTLGAEGVEIGLPVSSRQRAAVRYWDQQLQRGIRLTGVAGTDFHRGGALHGRLTGVDRWVIAVPGDRTRKGSLEQMRAHLLNELSQGRAQVLADSRVPTRVSLTLGLDGMHYQIGDTIDLGAHQATEGFLKVQVADPRGGWLVLIRDGQRWGESIPLPTAPNVTVTRRMPINSRGYLRAEIMRDDRSGSQEVLTNPIYWTHREVTATAKVRGREVQVTFAGPKKAGAAVFLTPPGVVPRGPSDPAILARTMVSAGVGRATLDGVDPGRYTASVFSRSDDGELLNFRLPATVGIEVLQTADLVSRQASAPPATGLPLEAGINAAALTGAP